MTEKSLQAQALTIGWDTTAITTNINLTLTPGKITVIAGPNGSGKSTLLKTIMRQIKPLSGTITLCGQNMLTLPSKDVARQIAYVPQSLELGQDLTVQELVMLGRNPHQAWWSWSINEDDRMVLKQALEKTETWDLKDKYLSSLSGGEKQRALVAVALAQQPAFMLLDEPTSALDFRHQLELVDLLKDLSAHGLGIMLVLHNLNLMAKLADEIIFLDKPTSGPGTVVVSGAPNQVLQPDNLQRIYAVEVGIFTDSATKRIVYLPLSATNGSTTD